MSKCDLCGKEGNIILYPIPTPDPECEDCSYFHVCVVCLRNCRDRAEEYL